MTFFLAAVSFIAGIAIRNLGSNTDRFAVWLNGFVIWVALPAMILRSIPGVELNASAWLPIVVPWCGFLAAYLFVYLFSPLFNWSSSERVALGILVGLGNTAFLGIPLIQVLLGDGAIATAILFDQLGSFLVLSICAITIIAIHSQSLQLDNMNARNVDEHIIVASNSNVEKARAENKLWSIFKRIFSFPPFISLLASLTLPLDGLQRTIGPVLDILSLTILPIALLVVGLHFRFAVDVRDFRAMIWLALIKLLVLPAMLFAVLMYIAMPVANFAPVLLQLAMPPMITPALLLIAAGIVPRLVATSLGYLTLLGCATVYAWSVLLAQFT